VTIVQISLGDITVILFSLFDAYTQLNVDGQWGSIMLDDSRCCSNTINDEKFYMMKE